MDGPVWNNESELHAIMFLTPALIFFLGMGFNQRSLNKAHGSVLNIIRQPSRLAAQTSYMQLFQPKPGSVSPLIFLYVLNLSTINPLLLMHIGLVSVCLSVNIIPHI